MAEITSGDKEFIASFNDVALKTEPNQTVFWSNDFRPDSAGKFSARNKQLAEDLTGDGFHKVIKDIIPVVDEMWSKDFRFNGKEISPAAKTEVSGELSHKFAEQAIGTVTVYANYTGATSFFRGNELPTLMENNQVTHVNFLDINDNKKIMPKAEWYNVQREQWVDGRIEKLNDTNKAWSEQMVKWDASHDKAGERMPEPNKFAVDDFANEMVVAYRNIAMQNKPSYVDAAKERTYANKLQNALQDIDNPSLRNRMIAKVGEILKDDNTGAKALFEADFDDKSQHRQQDKTELFLKALHDAGFNGNLNQTISAASKGLGTHVTGFVDDNGNGKLDKGESFFVTDGGLKALNVKLKEHGKNELRL